MLLIKPIINKKKMMKRSLKVQITKTVAGVPEEPLIYDGRLAFPGYPAINDTQLAQMPTPGFLSRLAAFKLHVENQLSQQGFLFASADRIGEDAYYED